MSLQEIYVIQYIYGACIIISVFLQTLYLPPGSCYTLFKPIKHGRLNVDDGLSLMGVANMLDDLWTKAIEDTLNIEKKKFKVKDFVLFSEFL